MSKYSIPFHIPVTHRLSSILHSLQLRCSTLHSDADEQGALGPPQPPSLTGLSVIFCPRQDIAHLPSSVGMGVHGRSHHLPHVRSTASIKDEFLYQSIPIPSSIPLCPNYFIWGAWISPESTILGRTWVPLSWQPQQTYAFVLRVSCVLCIHPFTQKLYTYDVHDKQITLKRLHVQ